MGTPVPPRHGPRRAPRRVASAPATPPRGRRALGVYARSLLLLLGALAFAACVLAVAAAIR